MIPHADRRKVRRPRHMLSYEEGFALTQARNTAAKLKAIGAPDIDPGKLAIAAAQMGLSTTEEAIDLLERGFRHDRSGAPSPEATTRAIGILASIHKDAATPTSIKAKAQSAIAWLSGWRD